MQSNPEFSTGGPALMSQFHKAFTGSLLHIGCLKKGVSPPPKHCSSQKKNVVKSYFSHRLLEKGISPPQKQRSFVICFYFYYTVYCCNVSTALCHITVFMDTCQCKNSCLGAPALHCESKKQATKLLPITSPNTDRFSKLFHC